LSCIENAATEDTFLDRSISIVEVENAISSLKSGKSTGSDLISTDMIKCFKLILVKPICHLYNIILDTGQFPSEWNTDLIVPIHKKGSSNDPANFRPIVLTNTLYKIFSKIICKRIVNHFNEQDLWSVNQCGF
jgi:hypothetical protein